MAKLQVSSLNNDTWSTHCRHCHKTQRSFDEFCTGKKTQVSWRSVLIFMSHRRMTAVLDWLAAQFLYINSRWPNEYLTFRPMASSIWPFLEGQETDGRDWSKLYNLTLLSCKTLLQPKLVGLWQLASKKSHCSQDKAVFNLMVCCQNKLSGNS